MTRVKTLAIVACAISVPALLPARAANLPARKEPAVSSSSLRLSSATDQNQATTGQPAWANFAWLEGRWQGNWGPRVAEQIWMAPKSGAMVGLFRETENDKTLVLELFSLVETPVGIEYRSRHFTPSLEPWEQSGSIVLKLATANPSQIVFENPTGGNPKRAIFTRTGPDTYISRSEIVTDHGDLQIVEITYHRQIASGGSAGRR